MKWTSVTSEKNEVFRSGFLQQIRPNTDLVTFIEEILNAKLHAFVQRVKNIR